MKKSKKNIIIFILTIIIILLSLLILTKDNKQKNREIELVNNIKTRIDNKENIILYLTYKDNYDYEANYLVDYLKDIYKLDITYVDLNTINNKDTKKILSFIDEKSDFVVPPAVIFIKDGKRDSIVNDIIIDSLLREQLYNNGYITEMEYNIEKIIYDDSFKEVYSSNDYQLILISNFSKEFNDYRKKIYSYGISNNFKYYLMYGFVGNDNHRELFSKSYGKDINSNSLLVAKDNKVIDVLEYKDIRLLEEFLKKYEFIK